MFEISGSKAIPSGNTCLGWVEVGTPLSSKQKSSCRKLLEVVDAQNYFESCDETLILPFLLLNKRNATSSFYFSDINGIYSALKSAKEELKIFDVNLFLEQICKNLLIKESPDTLELYQVGVEMPTGKLLIDILVFADIHGGVSFNSSNTSSPTKKPNVSLLRKTWHPRFFRR